ncbi:transposase [Gracilimonas tropica]|uniref:transposase n=1 Tax=Gracilimonas tropica TaxID=454600 RepID=UPI000374FAA6|nr:transposase [Gracilimonas tropica]
MTFYRRNLPHWQPAGADYFITLRLAGSIPKKVVQKLNKEKEKLLSSENNEKVRLKINRQIFKKYEAILDKAESGLTWLIKPQINRIVKESLHFRDGRGYKLYAYSIMSNHVHIVFQHISDRIIQRKDDYLVTNILASFKKYTGRLCNKKLNRTGSPFWQAESYDHVIRDSDELIRVIYYTLENPVKANLIDKWRDWPHSFCRKEFRDLF